jgi:hypothetical protein
LIQNLGCEEHRLSRGKHITIEKKGYELLASCFACSIGVDAFSSCGATRNGWDEMDHLKHFWLAAIIGWISSYSSI